MIELNMQVRYANSGVLLGTVTKVEKVGNSNYAEVRLDGQTHSFVTVNCDDLAEYRGLPVTKVEQAPDGLFDKHEVKRVDDKPVGRTFVIEFKDPQIAELLRAIAAVYADTRPLLSAQLIALAEEN